MNTKFNDNLLLTSEKYIKQKNFWISKLSGDISKTKLLYEYTNNFELKGKVDRIEIFIPKNTYNRLTYMSNESELGVYVVLVAVLMILTYQYTNNEDIIVISPIHEGNITGDTINDFVLIRNLIKGDMTFRELILKVGESVIEAYKNQIQLV